MSDEQRFNQKDAPSFLNGLLLGAAVGAAGFFLFGTKKGRKVKKALLEGGAKTFDDLKKTAKDLEKKSKKISKKAVVKKVELEKKAELTQKKVAIEIKEAERELKEAQKKAQKIKKKLTQKVARAKKRYFTRKGRSLRK